jgi:predicted transcriptional regulator
MILQPIKSDNTIVLDDTVSQCLNKINKQQSNYLPVIDGPLYIGCLEKDDLLVADIDKSIRDVRYLIKDCSINVKDGMLDMLKKFADFEAELLPVINSKRELQGNYLLEDLLIDFRDTPFFDHDGEELRLQKKSDEFSYSELCQIIESNNAQISGMFTSKIKNDVVEVQLKIKTNGLNNVLENLRRYEYTVMSDHQQDKHQEKVKESSAYLSHFLNI